jgi:hypothetical protein
MAADYRPHDELDSHCESVLQSEGLEAYPGSSLKGMS